jgi:hypothetical protein
MDPKAEKFPGLSPYAYRANNPILLDDPNGEDWSISAWQDKAGKCHINITVNAAVLNSDKNKHINMANYIKNEQKNFSNIFSMDRKDFEITATLNMRSVASKDEVKGSEHLIEIQKPEEFDDNVAGSSKVGGLNVRMNSKFINEDGSSTSKAYLSHELGHTGGLVDLDNHYAPYSRIFAEKRKYWFDKFEEYPLYNQKIGVDRLTNFMSYPDKNVNSDSYEGRTWLQGVRNNSGRATRGQVSAIMRYYYSGALNKNNK